MSTKYVHKEKPEITLEVFELDNAGWCYDCNIYINGEFEDYGHVDVDQLSKKYKRLNK